MEERMFSFFNKKNLKESETIDPSIHFELIGCALAYEVARSDFDIDAIELKKIKNEIENRSKLLGLNPDKVLLDIENSSHESISFNDFINQINDNFTKSKKLQMIEFLWDIAYADGLLEVDEERLIRRVANMILIKDFEVLKLKDKAKQSRFIQ